MEISLNGIKKGIITGLHRYHMVIFTIIVLGSLTSVVFLLNGIVIKSSPNPVTTTSHEANSFDPKTIDKLNQLKSRDETTTPLDLTKGRTNPFAE
jgi:hypothetical protein